ncbi:TPA: hypothetical protein EYO12_00300 [Candidatus Saccharibacteria bacterium]|nr:hypothetical protein [Candidatus Saccharibacteria bacterium]HIO87238.1 hypothetical protein [Candidatus Saccharibacteria bacterium]
MSRVQTFIFDHFGYDADAKVADFYYKTDAGHEFHERLEFNHAHVNDFPLTALEEALKLYWLLAGVSYYKAHLATTIEFNAHNIDAWQAERLNTIYTNGLGEFLYMNERGPDAVASFFGFQDDRERTVPKTVVSEAALVLIGGGKDSLTTVSLFDQQRQPYEIFRVNPQGWIVDQMSEIGVPPITVERTIDSFLTSDEDQMKGHVPITAIISASAIIAGILGGFADVVTSNEKSADDPNITEYEGMAINHQWSKGLELENIMQQWTRRYISSDLRYYSYLREMTEPQIAEIFSRTAFERFSGLWSSSNENFKQDSDGTLSWDLRSSKAISTFILLLPHIKKESLIAEFGGNPLDMAENKDMVLKLLGKKDIKPFECVPSPYELQVSMEQATKSQWPELQAYLG